MLNILAEKYAKSIGASILSQSINLPADTITFVLSTGPKMTMTEAQLLQLTQPARSAKAEEAPPSPPAEKPKKGKSKP
jgi:hypothetical protein